MSKFKIDEIVYVVFEDGLLFTTKINAILTGKNVSTGDVHHLYKVNGYEHSLDEDQISNDSRPARKTKFKQSKNGVEFFVVSNEEGYEGGFNSYSDAKRFQTRKEYGDLVVRINGDDFKIKPY
jgi:hypothetical protein